MKCIVCDDETFRARKITETDLVWAAPTNIPITIGHTLIMPKRHVTTIDEMRKDEQIALLDLAEKVKRSLVKAFGSQGFNVAYNEGKAAGQNVEHFHLHIVPRSEGDAGITEYEPRKFLYRPGSRPESPQQELLEVAAQIRAAL